MDRVDYSVLRWFGHMERTDDGRLGKRVIAVLRRVWDLGVDL